MSKKEFYKAEVIAKVMNKDWTQKRAGIELNMSLRQIKRLCKRYREDKMHGLAHKSRGKPSNHKINSQTRDEVLKLIMAKYSDFGPQLIKEQLEERDQLVFSREWIRRLMIRENLWKANKRKSLPCYQRRERRPQEGELIQIDGSYEKWFE